MQKGEVIPIWEAEGQYLRLLGQTPPDQFDRVRDKWMAGIPAILLNNLASNRGQNFPLEI